MLLAVYPLSIHLHKHLDFELTATVSLASSFGASSPVVLFGLEGGEVVAFDVHLEDHRWITEAHSKEVTQFHFLVPLQSHAHTLTHSHKDTQTHTDTHTDTHRHTNTLRGVWFRCTQLQCRSAVRLLPLALAISRALSWTLGQVCTRWSWSWSWCCL